MCSSAACSSDALSKATQVDNYLCGMSSSPGVGWCWCGQAGLSAEWPGRLLSPALRQAAPPPPLRSVSLPRPAVTIVTSDQCDHPA